MSAFFKLPKHYVFDYKPLYYDPKKEERKERFSKIRKELGVEQENLKERKTVIKFNRRIGQAKRDRTSTVRFLVILVLLSVLAYLFLFTDIVEMMTNYIAAKQ